MIVGVAYLLAMIAAAFVGSVGGVLFAAWWSMWSMRRVRAQMGRFFTLQGQLPRGLDAESAAILRGGPLKPGASTKCIRCGKPFTNPLEGISVQPLCAKCVMDDL